MRSQILILIVFWFARSVDTSFGQISTRPDGGIPVVTVCEALNNLTRYNGKLIVVVGKFANTREGAWLSEECERKIVTNRHTWDSVIYARSQRDPVMAWPERFKWDEELLGTKLKAVQKTTRL